MDATAVAIRLDAVERRFGGIVALRGISVDVRRGIITGLVGPDGAGKTTLMRLMAGLLAADGGSLRVEGCDPVREGDALRARLGYMPQKFGLYEDLSVQENLDLYADLRGVVGAARAARLARLLQFTDLAPFTARMAGKLSGGMKQKLGLACALLGDPRILLLDEPSVGVDPISRRELWKIVRELCAGGMTVLWSTSYLDEAELCDEVLLLSEGELKFGGRPADLTARLEGRVIQVRDADGNRRRVLQRALRLPGVIDGVIQGHAVRLVLRDRAARPDVAALQAGPAARLVDVKPRFEDAFIDLLGGGPGGDSVLAGVMAPVADGKPGEAVIEASHLTRRFGDFTAADDITFAVRRGEIFGLLGPNGAGKSTTFKMMCGLLAPSAGRAAVMGIDLKSSASRARQRLGYMAQKFSLYGRLSVRQNLEFFSGVYGLAGRAQRARIAEMVEAFDLARYVDDPAETLALGYKQRLALACAIMHEPAVLFLDEPTSGVDPITRREFWTHINGVVDKGVTVIVTTHFMDEAEYCDRIGLVYRGQLIAAGTPDALKDSVVAPGRAEPTMEDAFIELVERRDRQAAAGAGATGARHA
ncbi:MAG TPA: ATP-binding cassette domain-containing protein [Burkholderiaceae bacterium]|nr:ATP-binding cassette domain-containing protein [Burkholderiaceae bacterium]